MKGDLKRDFRDLEENATLTAVLESSITVLVPLYMFSLGTPIEEAGLIIALSPFIFGIARIIFSIISDIKGVKPFIILNSISYMFIPLILFLSPTNLGFSLSMFLRGIGRASFWSVVRTAAFKFRRRTDSSSKIVGIRYIGLSLGRFFSLLFSYFIGFSYTFFLLFLLGIKSIFYSLDIIEKIKPLSKKLIKREVRKITKKRSLNFYLSSLAVGFSFSSLTLTISFLLLYLLKEVFYLSLIEIAIIVAITYAFSSFIVLKLTNFKERIYFIFASFLSMVMGIYLISLKGIFVYLGASLLGIGGGIILRYNELIISKYMEREDRSLSIALLTLPISIIQAILYSIVGAVVDFIGIFNVMYIASFLSLLSIWEIHNLYNKRN